MEDEPPQPELSEFLDIVLSSTTAGLGFASVVLVVLLILSAMFSGAEIAFFSLQQQTLDGYQNEGNRFQKTVARLLERPKLLLATILIGNNLVNVGFIIYTAYLVSVNIPAEDLYFNILGYPAPLGWMIQVVGVTFFLLLFGEILPKNIAHQRAEGFAAQLAFPILYLTYIFYPLSWMLIELTGFVDKRMSGYRKSISVDDLSRALDLAEVRTEKEEEDHRILEGIVSFGSTDVKQIMKPRTDVEGLDITSDFAEVMETVKQIGFSRIPVYDGSFDKVEGLMYVKDLLGHTEEGPEFDWKTLMREPYYVPESKMIDDLLEEFRNKKMHMAIVVDEYGGTSGIVTMEDIIEEIVGDISDEFDDDEVIYSKLDDHNYVFEGKTSLKDFYRILEIDGDDFEENKGESDTIAGFILELVGQFPSKDDVVPFGSYEFTVESVDKKRIKRLKATINEGAVGEETESEEGNSNEE